MTEFMKSTGPGQPGIKHCECKTCQELIDYWANMAGEYQKLSHDQGQLLHKLEEFLITEDIHLPDVDPITTAIRRIRQLKIDMKGYLSLRQQDIDDAFKAFTDRMFQFNAKGELKTEALKPGYADIQTIGDINDF